MTRSLARIAGWFVATALAANVAAQTTPPTTQTRAINASAAQARAGRSTEDEEFAARGYLGTLADPLIRDATGRTVWDLRRYAFLGEADPATVNPSLWRHAGLLARNGLFRVTEDIYQVRGFDLANMTIVRGQTGWIIIDTLSSSETAHAALRLVTEKLGSRPIVAVLITHSHADHFGGTAGVLTPEQMAGGTVPIIAPAGFFDESVSESLIAGPAMNRRATYQFGTTLDVGPTGALNAGIGPALAVGTRALPKPTREIARDGTEMTIDGVRLRFQLTPGTEAPAEMNIAFPDWKVIDLAENANVTQHNILTPRGAKVRDAKLWVDGLTRAIEQNGDAQVMIASHGWPRFGQAAIRDFLTKHRDAYAFLHDQTVRLMNAGLTGDAIAAKLKLPDVLAREWYNRPYYGSVPFNVRAIYQFYLGWYDGNPVHLAPRDPTDTASRYVAAMGGAARVIEMARVAVAKGDLSWAAELLDHVVMANGDALEARSLLAQCYDQLAWRSENSLWRNIYLSGAKDLRARASRSLPGARRGALADNLSLDQLATLLAIRLDPAKATALRMVLHATDTGETISLAVENGVLVRARAAPSAPYVTISAPRAQIVHRMLSSDTEATNNEGAAAITRLRAMLDTPDPAFPLVLPPHAVN